MAIRSRRNVKRGGKRMSRRMMRGGDDGVGAGKWADLSKGEHCGSLQMQKKDMAGNPGPSAMHVYCTGENNPSSGGRRRRSQRRSRNQRQQRRSRNQSQRRRSQRRNRSQRRQ